MQEHSILSLSPTKRSFRSQKKLRVKQTSVKQQGNDKTLQPFKVYLNQYPSQVSEDAIGIIKYLQPIHTKFLDNLNSVKLYKSQLGSLIESDWHDFMLFLRTTVLKINRKFQKILQQKDSKINQLIAIRDRTQAQKLQIRDKLQRIQSMRQIQRSEQASTEQQLQSMSDQMIKIYEVMQSDMSHIMDYLTSVQTRKAKIDDQLSENIFENVSSLSKVLNGMQHQNRQTGQTLSTMRELIKAMAKNIKTTTSTQVDQSQLQTQAGAVFLSQNTVMPFEVTDGIGIATIGQFSRDHVIDLLKDQQRVSAHQAYNPKKNVDKPWALTPPLLVFLQNSSKQNQTGRVLPWEYMKQLINDIYSERVKYQQQIISGMVGNSLSFDEFVVIYFTDKHRIRRLTELKLLEFIISLKYYSKFWLKAEMFCWLMNVMKFQPPFDPIDSVAYKLDFYAQNYYFSMYSKLSALPMVDVSEGGVYTPLNSLKKLLKIMLFFSQQNSKSRLLAKLDKDVRVINEQDHTDFDNAMLLLLDQYFSVRKKTQTSLMKAFVKKHQQTAGYISVDDLIEVVEDATKTKQNSEGSQRFPLESNIHRIRLYLYSLTNGKNNFEVTCSNFIAACQRYGFDCPFPFLHVCTKSKKSKQDQTKEANSGQIAQQNQTKQQSKKQNHPDKHLNKEIHNQSLQLPSRKQEKVDVTVKLFSQHYALMRELKAYVDGFSNTLANQKDPEILWKNFGLIRKILERGCTFLQYPLIEQTKKIQNPAK